MGDLPGSVGAEPDGSDRSGVGEAGYVIPAARGPSVSALRELCAAFFKLGLISFGGPIAHLGYFHTEFVRRRGWLDDAAYADLVALCQFLPGPASSQVVFGLGMRRAGICGALGASVCFLLPSALLMIAFGYGISAFAGLADAGWVHGLKLAAVAVVGQAVWGMWRKLCPDGPRIVICLAAATVLIATHVAWLQIGVIAGGAIAGWVLFRRVELPSLSDDLAGARGHRGAVAALAAFALLLFLPPIAARSMGWRDIAVFDSFYRSGSLVFGGGHVVLPLLREEIVPRGWVDENAFLAGYGAAQAVPGPLFSFAGYLGAVIYRENRAWLGGMWCLLGIFLPGWLLIGGALPFWHRIRARIWAQAGLRGVNAAVVGVLVAALYSPLITEGVRSVRDAVVCCVAFGLLALGRVPPVAVVMGCAAAGEWVIR